MNLLSVFAPLWRGFGQLLFQPHAGTGVLVMLGIAVNSPLMLLAAFIGGGASTFTGFWLRQQEAYRQGLFGFNGILLGLAAVLFMEPSWSLWLLIALGGAATSWLFGRGLKRGIPVLTAPYIAIMLTIYLTLPILESPNGGIGLSWPEQPLWSGLVTGVGQMGFQGNLLSALFMAAGLYVGGGWRTLRWACIGSGCGAILGSLLGAPDSAITIGLLSYNSALIAVALGSTPGHSHPSWQPWLGILLATVLTCYGIAYLSLPVLTAPFVMAMWLVMAVNYLVLRIRPLK